MTLILHYHPLSSFCWKTLIALYEKGAPFEMNLVSPRDAREKAALRNLWPTATVPLLQDGTRVVPESSIIVEYVQQQYPDGLPLLGRHSDEAIEIRLWDRTLDQIILRPTQALIGQRRRDDEQRDRQVIETSIESLDTAYAMIEERMRERTWLGAEDFSMADCAAAPALFFSAIVLPFPADYTCLRRYFERLVSRASVEKAIGEARPFFPMFPLAQDIPARFLAA